MKNILIITEDFGLINRLFKFSQLTNFHLITASSYREGIKLINEQYADLIITDLDICQENNYTNLKIIRQLTFHRKTPILLLYYQLDRDLCFKIWELGISLFFQKMKNPEKLMRMVNQNLLTI